MDLTTPVTMDQVVKERERKERVGRGRNGQTTSLDEIEPLRPQREHSTPTRPGSPHTPPFTHHFALSIVAAATAGQAAADCPGAALHCPVLNTPGPNWTGNWLAD